MAGEIESVSVVQQALWLVSVALVWGATNPLIKRGSEGVSRLPPRSNALATMVVELVYLFTRWQYVVPFAVNMMGSVLFYYALAHAELSLVVPITNSLTFIFTSLTGTLLGEKPANSETYAGMALILAGVSLCISSKT